MTVAPGDVDVQGIRPRPYDSLRVYTQPDEQVPLSALVEAWYFLQRARQKKGSLGLEDVPALESLQASLRRGYEDQNAPILAERFCQRAFGACVLTGSPSGSAERLPRRLACVLRSPNDRLLSMSYRIEELEREAQAVFADRDDDAARRQLAWATKACYNAMTYVLAAADALSDKRMARADKIEHLEAPRRHVQELTRQVRSVVQRQARFTYFVGVLGGAVLTLLLLLVAGVLTDLMEWDVGLDVPPLLGAAVGGTFGAVVSVFQRLSTGNLVLDFTAPLRQRLLLGALRPLAGAVFGVVASLALAAGLTGTSGPAGTRAVTFSIIVGFLAGFSERLAIDILERAGRTVLSTGKEDGFAATSADMRSEIDDSLCTPIRAADVRTSVHGRAPADHRHPRSGTAPAPGPDAAAGSPNGAGPAAEPDGAAAG